MLRFDDIRVAQCTLTLPKQFRRPFFHLLLNGWHLGSRKVSMLTEDSGHEMTGLFAARWWAVLLPGTTETAFGVLAFAWPGVTVSTLVLRFRFLALADGLFSLLTAMGGRRQRQDRWLFLLEGIVGFCAGVVTLRAPALTALVLVLLISIWAMATGFLRIAAAVRLRKVVSGAVWLVLNGILSVLFALTLLLRPAVGALGLVWVIAGYTLILGVFEVMLRFELRSVRTAYESGFV
jgi:uncharacterized membrane protein HdeD (DUF308 family)